MAKDIVNLLNYLEIPKAHVAGYSLGGFITLNLLANYPDRVHSAIIGGAGWNDGSGQAGPTPEFAEILAKSLETGNGITPLMEALSPAGRPKPSAEEMKAMNAMVIASNDPLALAAVVRGMINLSVTKEQLQKNQVPIIGIVGEIDPLKAATDALYKVAKNADPMVIIPGGDHISALNNPLFSQSMKDFLKKHPMSEKVLAPAGNGN